MESAFIRIMIVFYHYNFIYNFTQTKRREEEAVKFIHTFVEKVIVDKIAAQEEMKKATGKTLDAGDANVVKSQPFLDYLIQNVYAAGKFTVDDLRDEVTTFLLAGTDTTSYTACFVLLTLALHRDVQEKVYDEIVETIGLCRDVEASDLPKMKYLERVIKETLRLFPIAPIIARHIHEDLKLKTITIPAGCSVVLTIHGIHMNPKYWRNPERFDPDRFLPEEVAKRNPNVYLPFSAGPRNCIGLKYAMLALKTVLATVVREYRVYTEYKSIMEVDVKMHIVLKPCNGFKLSMQRR